jgi:hypothetical protein
MLTIKSDKIIFCDVDDTLLFWGNNPDEYDTQFTDPRDGEVFFCRPNWALVKKLKKHKQISKMPIVVWSQSGWQWAEAAVKLLDLEDTVDIVCSKPYKYYDDIPVKEQGWDWVFIHKKLIKEK